MRRISVYVPDFCIEGRIAMMVCDARKYWTEEEADIRRWKREDAFDRRLYGSRVTNH